MSLSPDIIDRIVANVLTQISPASANTAQSKKVESQPVGTSRSVTLTERVVTAECLDEIGETAKVLVPTKAIITPAAWDVIRDRQLEITRGDATATTAGAVSAELKPARSIIASKTLVVVRNTAAVEQLWSELKGSWQRELLGCPDDAAKLAISQLCRGATGMVVIFAEQSFRAACLANRNERVKAVAVNDVAEVKSVKKQIRANTWCVNPTDKSYFELKNLLKSISSTN